MTSNETPRDPGDQANQAPQPREVEWGVAYPLFEDVSELRAALAHHNDFDYLGFDRLADIEGYGSSTFPEFRTSFRLPDGTQVNVYTRSETFDQIKANSSPSERTAPWGAPFVGDFTPSGRAVVQQFPLVLSADWRGPLSSRATTATISANGKEEPFGGVLWDEIPEEDQTFVGGLQPTSIASEDIATTLIPGSDTFVAGMSIVFHEPRPIEPQAAEVNG